MKILSLFDGISCARVALERTGIPVEEYHACEIDKYAKFISMHNYPDMYQHGSVIDFKGGNRYFDLLIGGSPCQDLSIAKKNRKGLSGERSGLFWEYVRILKEVKPKWFILENVNSMPKEAKELITKTLGVEPIMINASLVSAQNRKRLFWTNIPNVEQPKDRGILLKDVLENGANNRMKSYSVVSTIFKENVKSMVKRKKNGLLVYVGRVNKKDWVGDGKNLSRNAPQGDRIYSVEGKATTQSALGGGRGAKTGLYAIPVALRNRGEGKKPEYNGTGKANAMMSVQTDSMVQENSIIRKLTPIECERLQGLPDNYTEGISNTQRYKCLGNAFNVDVVAHILSFIPT
jgi:DNA (cytosine-5)-methyltransferase 3A